MLSAYFLRKIHSIMTNCKFVIGNEVKHPCHAGFVIQRNNMCGFAIRIINKWFRITNPA